MPPRPAGYLAFSLLHLGIAIWANNRWLVATLIATLVLMVGVVIPREERYLEGRFGAEYLDSLLSKLG